MKHGDGFAPGEIYQCSPATRHSNRKHEYMDKPISSLKPGDSCVSIRGRIVNLHEREVSAGSRKGARTILGLMVKDIDGIVEVKYTLATLLDLKSSRRFYLGRLCRVYANFIYGQDLKSAQKSPATVNSYIAFSDTDHASHLEFLDECQALYRLPMGWTAQDRSGELVSLRAFIERETGAPGVMLLVCVKTVGYEKTFSTPRGQSLTKVDVIVFDDTCDCKLTLWGIMSYSALVWRPHLTVLLITSAALRVWEGKPQLAITRATLVDVDPAIDVAERLRNHAQNLKPLSNGPRKFPGDEVFDWERELSDGNNIRLLYRLAEINDFAKSRPRDQCIGYLSVIVVEMNLVSIYKKNMLFYGNCCDTHIYCNKLETTCKRCEKQLQDLLPNRCIIGLLADETGCLPGSKVLFSHRAWSSFFGYSVKNLAKEASVDSLRRFEHKSLFSRLTMVFGLDPTVGEIAIWDIER